MTHRHLVAAALVVLSLVSGCADRSGTDGGSSASSSAPPGTDPTRVDTSGPPIGERCSGTAWPAAAIEEASFDNEDGIELFGAVLGSGPRGVVLVHGTGSRALCNWSLVAPALAADGFHVLAIDQRCQGYSGCSDQPGSLDRDVVAAVAALRARGARTVTVMGESRGAAVALAAAARPDFDADAVVALSGVEVGDVSSGTPVADLVGRIRVPVLYVSARGDIDQREYRAWAAATRRSAYVVLPSRFGHGSAMLGHPQPGPVYHDDVLPFLRKQARNASAG